MSDKDTSDKPKRRKKKSSAPSAAAADKPASDDVESISQSAAPRPASPRRGGNGHGDAEKRARRRSRKASSKTKAKALLTSSAPAVLPPLALTNNVDGVEVIDYTRTSTMTPGSGRRSTSRRSRRSSIDGGRPTSLNSSIRKARANRGLYASRNSKRVRTNDIDLLEFRPSLLERPFMFAPESSAWHGALAGTTGGASESLRLAERMAQLAFGDDADADVVCWRKTRLWKRFCAGMYWFGKKSKWLLYWLAQSTEQVQAIVPIFIYLVVYRAIFLVGWLDDAGIVVLGLLAVIVGLTFFMEGLNFGMLPAGEVLGHRMMERFPLPAVMFFVLLLGVLVTLAEPAINSLRVLGSSVSPVRSPHLYLLLNDWADVLLLTVAGGVAVASVLGILRIRYNWPLKPIIYVLVPVTLGLSSVAAYAVGDGLLVDIISLAWDCGAITTGPASVPMLLAFGIGGAQTSPQRIKEEEEARKRRERDKQLAREHKLSARISKAREEADNSEEAEAAIQAIEAEDSDLESSYDESDPGHAQVEGFGIVTMASLMPIMTVTILAMILFAVHPDKLQLQSDLGFADMSDNSTMTTTMNFTADASGCVSIDDSLEVDRSTLSWDKQMPWRELIQAVRAVLPLSFVLLLTIKLVLRADMPETRMRLMPKVKGRLPQFAFLVLEGEPSDEEKEKVAKRQERARRNTDVEKGDSTRKQSNDDGQSSGKSSRKNSQPGSERRDDDDGDDDEEEDAEMDNHPLSPREVVSNWYNHRHALIQFLLATFSLLLGAFLFNIGLEEGLAQLGEQIGRLLPSAFQCVSFVIGSPLYSKDAGVTLVLIFAFIVGALATLAEPALAVMGRKLEVMTHGQFTQRRLVLSVSVGVASGMMLGIMRVIYSWPLMPMLTVLYIFALFLTALSEKDIVNVAWDSAGVTTGPITVPFVISLGLNISRVVSGQSSFGVLALSSVSPVCSVLIFGLFIRVKTRAIRARRLRAAKKEVHQLHIGGHETPRSPRTPLASPRVVKPQTPVTSPRAVKPRTPLTSPRAK